MSTMIHQVGAALLVLADGRACVVEGRRVWEAELAAGADAAPAEEIVAQVKQGAGPLVRHSVELLGTALREREAEIAAAQLLQPFVAPSASDELRREWMAPLAPRAGDAERVFAPELAARANEIYPPLWQSPPVMAPRPGQSRLLLAVASAESIGASKEFPGGYRQIANQLTPGFVWVCWRFVAPDENLGLAFDGLVRIDDRFAWFPRPWQLL